MKTICAIGIVFLMLSASALSLSIPDETKASIAGVGGTIGTWSVYPTDYTYFFNDTELTASKTILAASTPYYGESWSSVVNRTTGTLLGGTDALGVGYLHNTPLSWHLTRRAFIVYDLSMLPIGGIVKYVAFNYTFNAGGANNFETYLIVGNYSSLIPGYEPGAPIDLYDFYIRQYQRSGQNVANETVIQNTMTNYVFNDTGRVLVGALANQTNSSIYLGMVLLHWYDMTDREPTVSNSQDYSVYNMAFDGNLTVVIDSPVTTRIPPPPGPYEYPIDAGAMTGMIQVFLWFIGLGGMIIVPMLVYAKTKEKGDSIGRFNGAVVLIGFFIVFLALFLWAIS